MNEQLENLPVPAVVVVSYWSYDRSAPMVYPSDRKNGQAVAFLSEGDLRCELAKLETLMRTPYRADAVPPEDAQAFIDARAAELVAAHREAVERMGGGYLRSYGFTDEELARMGLGAEVL